MKINESDMRIVKGILKGAAYLGTSAMLGGIGAFAVGSLTPGITHAIAKVCVPVASSVWSRVLKKHSDVAVEETVDQIAGVFGATPKIYVVDPE